MPSDYLTYFSIGLTVFMAVVLLWSFLWGLIRGWRKSTLRFGIFIGVSVIVLLCMPLILNLATSDITVNGLSLTEYVASLIGESMPATSELMVGAISASMALALAAMSTIVYIVLFILIQIITWIIFGICKLFIRKYKNAPKHRFLGGLIGIVQGLFVCFVFMIPVAGYTDIMAKVGGTVEAAIEQIQEEETPDAEGASIMLAASMNSEEDFDYGNEDEIVQDGYTTTLNNVKILKDINEAYKKSMPGFIYGVGGLDTKTFAYMSVAKVDGVKYSFVDEVDTVLNFANDLIVNTDKKIFDVKKVANFKDNELFEYLKEEIVLQEKVEATEDTEEIPAVTTTRIDYLVSLAVEKLLDSNLVKSVAVEAINALTDSTVDVINGLDEAERAKLFNSSTKLDASVLKIKVEDINWKTEKENISKVFSKVMSVVLNVMTTEEESEPAEQSSSSSLENIPLEEIGEVLDLIKETQLFENIFDPGLKRVLCIEKLIDEDVKTEDGQVENSTTETNKITIAEYVKNLTKEALSSEENESEGFDLAALGNYSEINFKNLFATIKKAIEISEKMGSSEDGKKGELEIGDLSALLSSIGEIDGGLKDQLNTTLHAVIENQLGDMEVGGQKLADLTKDLDIVACAPIIGSVMDVATVVGKIDDENLKLEAETIDTIVGSVSNIGTTYAKLDDDSKEAIDNLVGTAVNALIKDADKQIETTGIAGKLADDAEIVDCLLKVNFANSEEEKPSGEDIANAVKGSGLVAELLVKSGAEGVFTVNEDEEAAVKAVLGENSEYLKLFTNFQPSAN